VASALARPGTRPGISAWLRGGTPTTELRLTWFDSEGKRLGFASGKSSLEHFPDKPGHFGISLEKPLPKNAARLEVSIKNPGWSGAVLSGLMLLE
jgi:hypothetical protein